MAETFVAVNDDTALMAMDLRERGVYPPDITRPPAPDIGTFWSPDTHQVFQHLHVNSDWPRTSRVRDRSRRFTPAFDPGRADEFVMIVHKHVLDGQRVVVDLRNATQPAINSIVREVEARGLTGNVIFYP